MYPTPQKVQIDLTGAEDYYQYLEQQLNCEKFKINDFSEQNNQKRSLITEKNNQKKNVVSKKLNNLAEIDFNQEQVQGQQKNYSQTCKNFNNNKDFENRFSQNKEIQQNFQNKQEEVKFFNNNENLNTKKCSTPVNNLYKYNSYKNKENYPSQNKAVNDKQKFTFLQYQQKSQEKYRESTPQPLKQNSGENYIKDFQNMHSFIQGTPCNNQQNNTKDTFTDLQKYVEQNFNNFKNSSHNFNSEDFQNQNFKLQVDKKITNTPSSRRNQFINPQQNDQKGNQQYDINYQNQLKIKDRDQKLTKNNNKYYYERSKTSNNKYNKEQNLNSNQNSQIINKQQQFANTSEQFGCNFQSTNNERNQKEKNDQFQNQNQIFYRTNYQNRQCNSSNQRQSKFQKNIFQAGRNVRGHSSNNTPNKISFQNYKKQQENTPQKYANFQNYATEIKTQQQQKQELKQENKNKNLIFNFNKVQQGQNLKVDINSLKNSSFINQDPNQSKQNIEQNSHIQYWNNQQLQNNYSISQQNSYTNNQNPEYDYQQMKQQVSQNQELTQILLKGNSFKGGSNNQKISNIQDKIKSNVHQKNKEQLKKKEIQEQQLNENQNQINYNILQYQQQKQKETDKKYHLFKFSNQNSFNSDSQNEQINNHNNQQMEQKIKNQLQKLQNYQVTFQSYLQQQKEEDEPNRFCKQENTQNCQNFTQFQNKLDNNLHNEAQEEQDPFAQIIQNFKSINQPQGKQNNGYIQDYQNKFQIDNDKQKVNNNNTNIIQDKYQNEQNKSYLNNNSNCIEKQQQQNCHQFDQFQQQYKQKISKINQELQDMIQDLEESNYGSVSGNITLNGEFDDDLSLQTSTYNSIMVDNYSNAQNIKIFQNFSNSNNYGFKHKIKKQRNESEQDPFSQFLKQQISPEEQDFLNSTIRYE